MKKKKQSRVARLRKIGIVERDFTPAQRAGLYWRSAHRFLPLLNLWVKACCAVAFLAALACLVIVFTRPRPILLVSFPDGTTVCSLPPLDPKTGKIIPRPSSEAQLCRMLAERSGRADDEQNAEFAKFSQSEPPATSMKSIEEAMNQKQQEAISNSSPPPLAPEVVAPQPQAGI